jgi:hypothetical protein
VKGTEKNAQNLNWIIIHAANLVCIAYWRTVHHCANCIFAQVPFFHSSVHFCIFLSPFPQLSVYPSLHLPCYLHLPHHLYLALYRTKHNYSKRRSAVNNHCTLPINREIPYLFFFTYRRREYIELKTMEKLNF